LDVIVEIGEFVKQDEQVATIETDKVDIQVTSPVNGVVVEYLVKEGDTVAVGQDLLKIDLDGKPGAAAPAAAPAPKSPGASSVAPKPVPPPADAPKAAKPTPAPPVSKPNAPKPAAPAAEKPKPTASVPAPSKPVTFADGMVPGLAPLPAEFRTERRQKMNRMRQRISERLKESQNTAASLTTFNEVDMSNLMEFRKKYQEEIMKKTGIKLGFMSAFAKASVIALKEIPAVNASIEGDDEPEIVYHDFVDISVAVATPKGLVTPVLRNVEKLSFVQIENAIAEYGKKARENKISIEDMAGGTFTISNGGVFGSMFGTPIINMPQSAILGMHAVKERAVVVDGKIEIRPMMYLALTYDHRMIDGREAVTFLKTIKELIEDPRKMLLY
jgi:2-oxoglutarate dehydrogenase E2 component (dihydrolipoamide succinyltransferase)